MIILMRVITEYSQKLVCTLPNEKWDACHAIKMYSSKQFEMIYATSKISKSFNYHEITLQLWQNEWVDVVKRLSKFYLHSSNSSSSSATSLEYSPH